MQPIYDKLTEEGKIGPKVKGPDGKLIFKEFAEYPKQITTKGGQQVIVKSLVEEMELVGDETPGKSSKPDPLAKEKLALKEQAEALAKQKRELEEMSEKMKATLAEVQQDRAAAKVTETKPTETKPAETKPAETKATGIVATK